MGQAASCCREAGADEELALEHGVRPTAPEYEAVLVPQSIFAPLHFGEVRCCGGPNNAGGEDAMEQQLTTSKLVEHEATFAPQMSSTETIVEFFPMHTFPMATFMALSRMQCFGDLLACGALHAASGNAVIHFLSHEWLGFKHPDPEGVQLRRMQEVFSTIANGRATSLFTPELWQAFSKGVSVGSRGTFRTMESELFKKEDAGLTEESFSRRVSSGEVWLDFASIPQQKDFDGVPELKQRQLDAIRSIPAYLERCDYFWVLTPPAKHCDKGTWCSFASWRSRGWCRLEEWGNFLSSKTNAPLIITHDAKLSSLGFTDFTLSTQGKPSMAPCAGDFTCCTLGHVRVLPSGERQATPCDKEFVLPVLTTLFNAKRRQLKAHPSGSFLHASFITTVEPMLFGGSSFQPAITSESETIQQFLDRLGFESLTSSIGPGFKAWHLAARIGHMAMLEKLWREPEARALLEIPEVRTHLPNFCAMQGRVEAFNFFMERGLVRPEHADARIGAQLISPLDRAAKYGFPDMVVLLLKARASIDPRRDDGSTPLHGAAGAGHVSCCSALLDGRADVNAVDGAGRCPLHLAADPLTFYGDASGKPGVLQVLLRGRADPARTDGAGLTALEIARRAIFHEGIEVLEANSTAKAA